jgi:Flp pilus assembly protein TadD
MPAPAASARLSLALLAGLAAGACASTKPTSAEQTLVDSVVEQKAILPASREEREMIGRQDLLAQATFWSREHEKNPNEYEAALKLAQTLRALGSSAKAMEVASQALVRHAGDIELTLAFTQAALDSGQPDQAVVHLARAEAPGAQDWRIMSVIGVVMDQLGQHPQARDYYAKALALSPDNPKVLSNLALSLALDNRPVEAEETLRRAAALTGADTRVRQNLALVLGVQGKFEEAGQLLRAEAPESVAQETQAYYRSLLTPARSWDRLRGSQP